LAQGAAISAVYLNIHKTTTFDEAFANGSVYMVTMIRSTGAGLGIGALIKGDKTTFLVQGNQTKYDLYKNWLNDKKLFKQYQDAMAEMKSQWQHRGGEPPKH
jgi:hypothetical protein